MLTLGVGGAIDQITLLGLDAQVESLAFGGRFVNRGHGGVSRMRRYSRLRNDGVITTSRVTGSNGVNVSPSK
jgi:hypothetical protein